jgi:two-component system OmpR family sensor kinase
MNKNSIYFTISLSFILSLIIVIASFSYLYNSSNKRELLISYKHMHFKLRDAIRMHKRTDDKNTFKIHLKQQSYEFVDNINQITQIMNTKSTKILQHMNNRRYKMIFLKVHDKKAIYIQIKKDVFLLINNNDDEYNNEKNNVIFFIFFVILLSLIILYYVTIKKLLPLKTLHEKIKSLENEDFDLDCASDKKDEISKLSNQFHHTAYKLKMLKDSRNVFIRNIMHELKTPITKGKLLLHLEHSEKNNENMHKVFYRLEALISEFTSVEELIGTTNEIDTKDYFLVDIIDNAMDLLMCEEKEVIYDCSKIKMNVNFNLFTIAIKNLMDNAIKYSSNNQVVITNKKNMLIFKNKGEKLHYAIEKYYEAFFKGDKVKSNESFGLGLYIVKHILDAHNILINYKYENDENIFILTY